MPEITKRRYISAEAAVAMTAAPLAPTSCAPSIVSIVRPVMSASIWHVTGESGDCGPQAHARLDERTSGYLRLAIRPRALSIAKIRYPSTTKATTIAPMKSATPSAPEMAGSRKV